MEYDFIEAKSILSPIKKGPDKYFGILYSMNIYRGCQHGCIYCDSRSKVYNLGNLSHIRLKRNALALLEQELKKKKRKGTIGTGSMNDPYMPLEKRLEQISKALSLIHKFNFPVHIITKSKLVTRDKEIIKGIDDIYAAVSFTINTTDDELSKKIEPGAPASSERFQAMYELSKMGIYTGTIISPVLPFITDKASNIKSLIRYTKESGGQYILAWMGLTQREGQREYFYNQLDEKFPGISKRYHDTFNLMYNCPSPQAEFLFSFFNEECQKLHMPTKMRFYSPPKEPIQLNMFH